MPDLVRWTFHDPATDDTYTFWMNPNDGGSPDYKTTLSYVSACAPDGVTVAFQGRDEPQKLEFSGRILVQEHYDAFVTWQRNKNPIEMTDDLGRTFVLTIESFAPKRKKSARYPWKHDFTITTTLLVPST